jgi:hypothetical protein
VPPDAANLTPVARGGDTPMMKAFRQRGVD